MKSLVVLAAGMGSRFGGLKQVEPVGPSGETLMDYSVFDALQAGFDRIVFVIRKDFEDVFRTTVAAKYEGRIAIEFAFQDRDDLPTGFSTPAERTKPWGTAHAIRAARNIVKGPFAAINADDFYGRDAFARVGAFLDNPGTNCFAMVGYRLDQTLSEHGHVARGVTTTDASGRLLGITEMTKIIRDSAGIRNVEIEDSPVALTGGERVSMNLWGFTPQLFEAMESRFPRWLEANLDNIKAEWYIPFLVDDMIRDGEVSVRVLPTDSSWFGVTYREDKPKVTEAISALVRTGSYPSPLFG